MPRQRKIRQKIGDVVAIKLGDGTYGYGRVLPELLTAIYDLHSRELLELETILAAPVLFAVWVSDFAITDGTWPVLGNAPLTPEMLIEPVFFKKDPITGALTIYHPSTGKEVAATKEECSHLECAAVWQPHHMVDRIQDYFAGRPNKWAESLRA